MTGREVLTIDQLRVASEKTIINAKDHLQTANILAESKMIPHAMSHLVFASEELCKASILRIKMLAPQADLSGLDNCFHEHKAKHDAIWRICFAIVEAFDSPIDDKEKIKNGLSSNQVVDAEAKMSSIAWLGLIMVLLDYFSKKENGGTDEKKMSMDQIRNAGLYVDYKGTTWHVPNEMFLEEDYKDLHDWVVGFFETIEKGLFSSTFSEHRIKVLIKELQSKPK